MGEWVTSNENPTQNWGSRVTPPLTHLNNQNHVTTSSTNKIN
jgi:hypothetical protein